MPIIFWGERTAASHERHLTVCLDATEASFSKLISWGFYGPLQRVSWWAPPTVRRSAPTGGIYFEMALVSVIAEPWWAPPNGSGAPRAPGLPEARFPAPAGIGHFSREKPSFPPGSGTVLRARCLKGGYLTHSGGLFPGTPQGGVPDTLLSRGDT